MAKKGGGFANRAAKRFASMDKIDLMSQDEIFSVWKEDMAAILDQLTDHRNGRGQYPTYVSNSFANLSSSLFIWRFVKKHVKVKDDGEGIATDLSSDQVKSLKQLIADAFKRSERNEYEQQTLEYDRRNELLGKAFCRLAPRDYRIAKKFEEISKARRRSLVVNVFGDPIFNIRKVAEIVDAETSLTVAKKLKLLKKMYGKKRFVDACGAAMTITGGSATSSDLLSAMFDIIDGKSKKKVAKYILAYAKAYKRNKGTYYRITQSFFDEIEDIIEELVEMDIGFEKAFNIPMTKTSVLGRRPLTIRPATG